MDAVVETQAVETTRFALSRWLVLTISIFLYPNLVNSEEIIEFWIVNFVAFYNLLKICNLTQI